MFYNIHVNDKIEPSIDQGVNVPKMLKNDEPMK